MKIYTYLMLFAFILIAGSCSKDDKDSDNNNSGTGSTTFNIDSPWQYSFKIDGTTYARVENGTTIEGAFSNGGLLATWPDSTINNYGSGLYNPNLLIDYFDVSRNGHKYVGAVAEDSVFFDFFAPGNYSYAPENVNGISIRWTDDNGIVWGTDLGSGIQTGSSFTIDEIKEVQGLDYTLKVLAHFNCTFYDGSGNSKIVTEGKSVSKFANY